MAAKKAKATRRPSRACLHCTDEPKNKKLYPIPVLIEQLLCTINMFEGTDEAHLGHIVEDLRGLHCDLKNKIGIHPEYQDNKGLQKLDKAYAAAGWDNNGLRWTSEEGEDDPWEDIFIVEFDNHQKTKWHVA